MSLPRTARIEEIFHAALEQPAGARAAFLDEACDAADIRVRVDALIAAHEGAGDFLEPPTVTPAEPATQEGPGTRIGRYKLLQRIGEGGMGVVYMAEQEHPVRRKVALKIIKLGMDTEQVIARFEAERQALALMDHINISRVLDAGATDSGRPYFVMELVRGIPIDEYCDKNNLSTRERLSLFVPVCNALQHAHQKGIIHRDIKPQNVLVTLHDGTPVPKVIDFGIAKATNQRLTEKTLFTEFRQFIGTPEYMSPEQAEMSGLDVDTRTDIYALGVLLYELLTGVTPFDAKTLRQAGYMEMQRIIREEEPPNLSTRISSMGENLDKIARHRRVEAGALGRLFRGDLDWIVMRALEKDRTRRYESAGSFAADVRRYLDDEPVLASPPSARYRFRKFVRRNRVKVLAGSLAAAALLIGSAVAVFGLVQAKQEAARSQRIADFLQDMLASTDPQNLSDVDVAQVLTTARSVFGNDHATVAATLSSRALQLQAGGHLDSAEALHREALGLARSIYGDDHLNVGTTLSRLGSLLLIKGDNTGAEEAFRESLRITKSLPEGGGVARSVTLFELASVLMNQGKFKEAIALLDEAIRLRRVAAPVQLLSIAVLVNARTNARVMGGETDGLEEALEEVVAAWRAALPRDSALLAKVLTEVGVFHVQRGDRDEAERLLREAVEIMRKAPERTEAIFITAMVGLSVPMKDREFIDYAREVVGDRPVLYAEVLSEYAERLERNERLPRALAHRLTALEALEGAEGGARHIRKQLIAINAVTWKIGRRPGRLRSDYERAYDAAKRVREDFPEHTRALGAVVILQYRLERYAEALETIEQFGKVLTKQGIEPGWDLAYRAMVFQKLGRTAEARALYEQLEGLMDRPELARDSEFKLIVAELKSLIDPD